MAIRLGDALLMLGADDDKLKKDLDGAEQKARGWGATMTGVLQGFGMGIAGAIGGMVRGAWDTVTESIGAASDLAETVSKVRTLFGDASTSIEDWASGAAANLGMTKQAALDAVGTIGNLFLQLGQNAETAGQTSQALVQLATDLGSFHNADPTEILDSMSAAFRGEYDSLQKYVPMINAANVEQRALADTGKTAASELTALDKATAAYELTVEGAGAATGDFARTSDGWANSMKTLNAYWAEFKTLIGETLLPVLTPLLDKVKDLANQYLPMLADYIHNNVIPAIDDWAANFDEWWADHGQPFLDAINKMWDDIITKAAEATGQNKEDFTLTLEGMQVIAGELGAAIGRALGAAITSEAGQQLTEWASTWFDNFWRTLVFGNDFSKAIGSLFPQSAPPTPAPPAPTPGSGLNPFQSAQGAITINNYVDATSRTVGEAARDGTLDALHQAGVR